MGKGTAIYTRISQDRSGEALGVNMRQEPDCRAHAQRLGLPKPYIVYSDNDISASRKDGVVAHRPQFTKLCDDIEDGLIGAVVAWDMDRLFRDPLEQEHFLLLCERSRMHRIATLADDVDISSGEGIMVARIKAAVAAEEARKIRKRIKRKMDELAEHGKFKGGAIPFGYRKVDEPHQLEPIPEQAEAIRRGYDMILAGEPLAAVARAWNEAGFRTPFDKEWTFETAKLTLLAARNAGLRERNVTAARKKGVPDIVGKAVWPAIVPEHVWRETFDYLAVRGRRYARTQASSRESSLDVNGYWLRGLVTCGLCGHTMSSRMQRNRKYERNRRYTCWKPRGGCNQCSIDAEKLEALILDLLVDRLDTFQPPEAIDSESGEGGVREELMQVEMKLSELEDAYYLGDLARKDYDRLKSTLRARMRELKHMLSDVRPVNPAEDYINLGARFREDFPTFSVDRKNAIAHYFISRIQIAKAVLGRKFDPSRVSVELADLR